MNTPDRPRRVVDLLGFAGDVGLLQDDSKVIKRVSSSGARIIHVTAAFPMLGPDKRDEALGMIERTRRVLDESRHSLRVIESARDIETLEQDGEVGVVIGLQDSAFIGDDMGLVPALYDRGVRVMQLAYQDDNGFGGGFLAEEAVGISRAGRELVEQMMRHGIIFDASHLNRRTALDAIEICPSGKVMISHTTARAVYDHSRGSHDDVLQAVAKKLGVVGVLGMTFFLDQSDTTMGPLLRHTVHVDKVTNGRAALGLDGPVGGFADLEGAEAAFNRMQGHMDPNGELGSSWPSHVPKLFHTPGGYERLAAALTAEVGEPTSDAIMGETAWDFLVNALPS